MYIYYQRIILMVLMLSSLLQSCQSHLYADEEEESTPQAVPKASVPQQEIGNSLTSPSETFIESRNSDSSVLSPHSVDSVSIPAPSPHAFTQSLAASPASARQAPDVDLCVPIEVACPLVGEIFKNASHPLCTSESIDVLTTCVAYGDQCAAQFAGKKVILVAGHEGAGKSIFLNYLLGCDMELGHLEDMEVVVKPTSLGGCRDEIIPVSHKPLSKNFMPQVGLDESNVAYCECPGFSNTGRAELNIPNVLNMRAVLQYANQVSLVILLNYHTLQTDRSNGLSEILKICNRLFGNEANLNRYKDSLLLCVTQAPLNKRLVRIKQLLSQDMPPIMHVLADRMFLYDPLDRGGVLFWNRTKCVKQIASLRSIDHAAQMYQTALTDSDIQRLEEVVSQLDTSLQLLLSQDDYETAASRWHQLQRLYMINHLSLDRMLHRSLIKLQCNFYDIKSAYELACMSYNLVMADQCWEQLLAVSKHFAQTDHELDLDRLRTHYTTFQNGQHVLDKQGKDSRNARNDMQLLTLLDEQKRELEGECVSQDTVYKEMEEQLRAEMAHRYAAYDTQIEKLHSESEKVFRQQEEALALFQQLNDKEFERLTTERSNLKAYYKEQLETTKEMRTASTQVYEARLREYAQAKKQSQDMLSSKLAVLEEQEQKEWGLQKLKATEVPNMAFGAVDWKRYLGEVGNEPSLPKDIDAILNSACPFWEGSKVKETHLLVLIPARVNDQPFSLNLLGELIRRPRGGGHGTQYLYYESDVRSEIGEFPPARSYWMLMTRDVLAGSRNKTYAEQKAMIARYERQGYALPTALEAATVTVLHHVRTGECLFSDDPWTYTRCQDMLVQNGYPALVGGFSVKGLKVFHYDYFDRKHGYYGISCCRKL